MIDLQLYIKYILNYGVIQFLKEFINAVPVKIPVKKQFFNDKYKYIVSEANGENDNKIYSFERILQMGRLFKFSEFSENAISSYIGT